MIPYRKLSLGAGGVKGILHIGALLELSKHQELNFPDGIYGSSIGSILATHLSFKLPLDTKCIDNIKTFLSFDKILPTPTFEAIRDVFSQKGMFDMEEFEKTVINWFKMYDIDISSKKIGDTINPLYIVSSNITKGVPTIFSKDVPILKALKCSCCIPGIFKPQDLYGQLYIDGGVFIPSLTKLAPDSLYLHLTKKKPEMEIKRETLTTITPFEYMTAIQVSSVNQFISLLKTENTLELEYPNLHSLSNLEEFDIDDILKTSSNSMRSFLTSKGFLQESSEVICSRLS